MSTSTAEGKDRVKSESSAALTGDPLLACLVRLCPMIGRPISAEALIAGLPLVDNKLTPELFIRAANRAGLSAATVARPLDKLHKLVLPAVLLLNDGQACILAQRDNGEAVVVEPATGGSRRMPNADLSALYSGRAILAHHKYTFDRRTDDIFGERPSHWFWDVVWKSWPIYSDVLLASLLVNLFALASPLFVMNVYDRVVPNKSEETLWVLAAGMLTVILFDFLLKMLRGYFVDAAGKRTDLILSSTIFERVLGIKMEARPESIGSFANNLQEYESFRDFLTSATITALIDIPFLVLFLGVIALLGGNLALIPLFALPIGIMISLIVQRPLKATIASLFRFASQKGATLIESLSSLETIKTQGAASHFQRRWEDNIGHIANLGIKVKTLSQGAVNATGFLQQLAYVLVVVFGVYKVAENDMTLGGLIACTILTSRALAPLAQVASLLTRYHQARASLDSLNSLMKLPIEREHIDQFVHRPHFDGGIEFKHVTFAYPNSPVKALDNISFRIAPGEHVAIIGRIGCGKTTLEKLILGLYQPQEGAVLLDGTDLRQIDPTDIRRTIGYVPQEVQLFYGSVKDNIIMGAAHASGDAAILRAAEIAGVSNFVNIHPAGFDLPVGERGVCLSGGQRQSIALARALLLAPPIYVMDEPTNAMDNSTEEYIKQRLKDQLSGKTFVVVTHRASLLSLVDRILVLDNGRIVADGPRDQVLEALKKGQIKVNAA